MSTMDTTGFDQVGRYGTLSLLKKRSDTNATVGPNNSTPGGTTSSSAQQVITSFGIDSANLTFGRDMSCDVRLYYFSVDPVHCRLVNEDGKAFMVVQGKAGALVDGCWVYPHTSSASGDDSEESQQTIVPLVNNSEFEIQGKRFCFTYPPKGIRKVLLNTPVAQRNRKLRLSMIQSAQVFTPRPSKDPRENLRILQSPIKANIFSISDPTVDRSRSQSPHKPRAVSPLKFGVHADDEDSDEEMEVDEQDENDNEEAGGSENTDEHIVLVHTNHPRVVEEDRDLVILEDVPLHLILPSPSVYNVATPTRLQRTTEHAASPTPAQRQAPAPLVAPQPQPQPPRTPRRRGGNALHRAVLIRSAQRAVWRAEKEKEEEEEEMEVLGTVVGGGEGEEEADDNRVVYVNEDVEMEDVEMRSISDEEDEEEDEDGEEDEDEEDDEYSDEENQTTAANKPLWRKSLERIIPWPFSPKKNTPELREDSDEEDEDENEEQERDGVPAALPQQKTPGRKALGSFMTPQPQAQQPLRRNLFPLADTAANDAASSEGTSTTTAPGPGRYSLGGGEARRVLVQQPWRIKDLVVPPLPGTSAAPLPARGSRDPPPTLGGDLEPPAPAPASTRKVTEEERKAIQERRRSAVREVRGDSFWKDGAPGMSPSKVRPSPAKPPTGLGIGGSSGSRPSVMGSRTPGRPLFTSPTKGRTLDFSIAEADKEDPESPFLDRDSSKGKAMAATPKVSTTTVDDDDGSLDTHGLLERMRETVEDMKRRRSIVTPARLPATPVESQHSIFKLTGTAPRESVKKIDFSHIAPATSKGGADPFMSAPSHEPPMPASSSHVEPSTQHEERNEENQEPVMEPEPFSLLAKTPVSRKSSVYVPETMEVEDDSAAPAVPSVVVDAVENQSEPPQEPEPEPEPEVTTKARGRSRLLRAPKEEPEVETLKENAEEAQEEVLHSKPRSATRTKPPSRSRNAKSPAPVEPESTVTELVPEPSGSGTRRTRSRTPQPPAEVEVAKEERVPRSATRRTRQTTAEPEEAPAQTKTRGKKVAESETEEVTDSEQIKPTPARRGRKPRAVPAAIEEGQEDEAPAPAPNPATVKRGRSKKKEVATVPEEDEDADELNSYDVNATGAEAAPVATSSKKTTKSQGLPLPKGRKKETSTAVPNVKQEAEDKEEEAPPLAATRSGRGTRANAAITTTTATKTPATAKSKIPMVAKARGRPKTPATAPAATTAVSSSSANAEKENTPGTRSGSGGSDEGNEDTAAVKVRITRKTGAAATTATTTATRQTKSASKAKSKAVKVEDEGEEEQETTTKTRATRTMRTRTKAG